MCGKSLVEETAMNSTTDGKTELKVENVGDGDGTFVAGKPNRHLNIAKAMGCTIARMYLVKAFYDLGNANNQIAWVEAQNTHDLAILTTLVHLDLESILGMLAYASIDAVEAAEYFDYVVKVYVISEVGTSRSKQLQFAADCDVRYKTYWKEEIAKQKQSEA